MCGILGQVRLNSDNVFCLNKFKESLDLMYHRGPDDSDILVSDEFIFGHRRLSIIDLASHAKQPMQSACGNFTIVFNGEIYNYRELRDDLIEKGYQFRTASDTEVLLQLFIEYGIYCIHQLIGMFAFSIHDVAQNTTYVVRDRLGIKPLYYFSDSSKFIFASEIKSILSLGDIDRKLNLNAVSSYLSFRYPILGNTFFEGINSLAPAHYIKITTSGVEFKEYWSVAEKFKEQEDDKGEAFYKEKLNELLKSAVEYRMISDVPFGAFLSGGVDSSVITALMAESSNKPVKTYTIGFEEEGYNEFDYAKLIAEKYQTDHMEITVSGNNYLSTMEKLIAYKDSPLSVPNEVPLYLMAKELKNYITVVLSGEGADEIFGGYGRIFRSPGDFEKIKNIDNLALTNEEKDTLCKNFIKKYATSSFESEIEHFVSIYSYTSFDDKKKLLSRELELDSIENSFVEKFLGFFDELENESYSNRMLYVFEKIHLVGLLHRVDMTTMATSVEARVPFVDHRLVEFAFTIPLKYKLKWNDEHSENESKLLMSDAISENYDTPKYILKKTYENLVPDEVLYRKKMGFPVPLNDWFGGDFNEYARNVLLSDEARERNLYNIENIEAWLSNEKLNEDHSFAMKIWMLINIELFVKKYFS